MATSECIFLVVIGAIVGIIIGAIPGLTATMAIALMIPMTFTIAPVPSIAMLISTYCGAMFGGSLSAILINTPGTPAATATCFDGYPMAKNGEAGRAMKMALYSSFAGGIISATILIFTSPIIAKYALMLGPGEYTALICFAMTMIASVSQGNMLKGVLSACIGLLLGTIGLDPMLGSERFTFGNLNLLTGIPNIAKLIGMFALAEIIAYSEDLGTLQKSNKMFEMKPDQSLPLLEVFSHWKTILRGSLMGCFVGALPGIGGSVCAYINYAITKNESSDPDSFGKGNIAGIAAVECTNNGSTGGTMIPLLTLGIPGDTVTAVLLGAFMLQGIAPGPMFFKTQGNIVYALFCCIILANLIIMPLGHVAIKCSSFIAKTPTNLLFPVILCLCVIGAYASDTNMFSVVALIVFGLVGYLMRKLQIPISPFLIAGILGPMLEDNIRRTYTLYRGNMLLILKSPIAVFFIIMTFFSLVFSFYKEFKDQKAKVS